MDFLFHVRGVGGVGKSSLVRHWQGTARSRSALTAVVDEVDVRGVVEAMEAVASQLDAQGGSLKAFGAAVERYRKELEAQQQAAPESSAGPDGAGDTVGEGTASASSRAIAQVALGSATLLPGVGVLAGLTSPEIAAQGLDRLRTGIRERGRRVRDSLSYEPVKALSTAFVQELERLAEEHPWLVLFFDTWEQTGRYLDLWLRDLLLDVYGPMPANVLVVLAGQNELDEREWAELRGQITDVPLEVFSEQEARALLTARGVSDNEPVIREILHLSMGLPLLVDTLAHIHPGTADDQQEEGYSADVAVARFVRWIPDPVEQATVLSCALPIQLNEDVFHAVAPDTASGHYGWLCRQPFVTGHGTHRQYHDVVRTSMLRYLRTRSPLVWTERHTQLAEAYARWRITAEDQLPPEERWADPDWRSHRLNETYHHLCAHPRRHLTIALEDTVHAAGHSLATLRRWIDVLVRAGRDTANSAVTEWGERLAATAAGEQPFIDTLARLLTAPSLSASARAHGHMHQGWHLYLADRDDEAITAYGHAISADRAFAQAHIRRGMAHSWSERHERALSDFDRAIELDPDNVWAIAERGEAYRLMDRHDAALADLDRAIELAPTYDVAIAERGSTYRLMGRYDEALADYDRAIELNPDNGWAVAERGETYRLTGRHDAALTELDRAVALAPANTWAIINRGRTYSDLGRYDDAITDYTRALTLAPNNTWAITNRGRTYSDLGRYDDAITDYTRALTLAPNNTWAITNRGRTYSLMGRYDDAITDYTRALDADPANDAANGERGDAYRAMGQYEKALADYECAIEVDPENVWAYAARGVVYRQIGRLDDARSDLERVIQEVPTDWDALFELAMLKTVECGPTTALPEWLNLFDREDEPTDIKVGARFLPLFRRLLLEQLPDTGEALREVLRSHPDHDTAVDLFLYLEELEGVPGEHVPEVMLCRQYLRDHCTLPLPGA